MTGLECVNKKTKRDIFRYNGDKPAAINLEHVTMIAVDGNKINFSFPMNGVSFQLESEESAKNIFEQLLKVWAEDVLE